MIRFYQFILFVITLPAVNNCLSSEDSTEETVKQARAILDKYHSEKPQPGNRKLHIICWRPTDRDYARDNQARLTRIMKHIQDFYGDEMERMGFGRRTLQLDYDSNGKLVIHKAVGDSPYADYSKPEGQRVQKDCWPVLKEAGLNPDRETIVIFTNLSNWDPVENTFVHKSPYYARGSNRNGVAWQLDSPELDTKNLGLKKPMIQDGEYGRISLGKHNSIFIGGIAHELGHGLGLPHCRARNDEAAKFGTALMGSGNRTYGDEIRGEGKGSFLTLAHGLRLASHPQFSGSIKGMNLPAKAGFSGLTIASQGKGFTISGIAKSMVPVYAVIAYLDPAGGGDYDARTITTVPDSKGEFSLKCDALVPGKPGELRVLACLANGATTTWRGGYLVARDGTANISAMKMNLELADFVTALNQRKMTEAKAISESFANSSLKGRITSKVLQGRSKNRATIGIEKIPAELKEYPLSGITPVSSQVGWHRPAYDHIPRETPLLVSGGELFETGIYAHADSRHVYSLEGGDWKSLEGKCGLPNQRGGSVVFVIRADGRERFRSKKIEPGRTVPFRIGLNGVSKLELVTEDAGDGKAVDWGFWFAPTLKR